MIPIMDAIIMIMGGWSVDGETELKAVRGGDPRRRLMIGSERGGWAVKINRV